ncbi:alpha/beta hydrolase [Roseibium sp. FZY0029]|uniref:alpha/beta fold hydrolase n=1 Tax=Roseibium sp. FZY0029 TaxID=3116647 RepID=UPI002EBAD657|nr:alpha/beta hydrolase [Roseibium sp. FZY0029]
MNTLYRTGTAQEEIEMAYRALLEDWPIENHKGSVSTRYGDTFVISSGRETSPSLLLLHGSMANSASWMRDIPDYARHYRCHAIDMIGEPGLSAPARPAFGSDAYALWLDDVLAALGVNRTAIVGLSLGGWLALDYAIRRPGRVSTMALLAPGGVGRQRNILLRALPLMLLGRFGKNRLKTMITGPRPKDLSASGRAFFAMMDLIQNQFRPRRYLTRFSDNQLRTLDMSILAILGGRDVMIDSEETRARLETNVPTAQIDFRPDGRHFMPDTVRGVLAFLSTDEAPE